MKSTDMPIEDPAIALARNNHDQSGEKWDMDRRQFLHSAAAAALTTTLPNSSAAAESVRSNKMIGLQVGAESFVDESVENALDEFQRDAAINSLFLETFTYGRGIAGRQVPGPCSP